MDANLVNDVTHKFRGMVISKSEKRPNLFYTNDSLPPYKTIEAFGRRYLSLEGNQQDHHYYLPFDETEWYRLKCGHSCWLKVHGIVCPPHEKIPVGDFLDLGTSDGSWVHDICEKEKVRRVFGFDLYFVSEPQDRVNAFYAVRDCEKDFEDELVPLALINLRDSYLWVRNLRLLIGRVHNNLMPGGWFQSYEVRMSDWTSDNVHFNDWKQKVLDCAKNLQIQLHRESDLWAAIKDCGFNDCEQKVYTWMTQENDQARIFVMEMVWASYAILRSRYSDLDIFTLWDRMRSEFWEGKCQVNLRFHICWARK